MQIANLVFNDFTHDTRVLKTAKTLANADYNVEVIAHGNKALSKEEQKENFKIRRFSYLDRKITSSILGKLKAYIKYAKQSIKHCKEFDVLHCNDLNTLPIATIIKLLHNKKLKIIYDAHEYETETIGLSGIKKKIIYLVEKKLIKYADEVITVSNSIANEYSKLYNIQKPKIVLNAPPYKQINKHDLFREQFNIDKNKNIFLYQGGLTKGRGIEILLEAFSQIQDKNNVIVFMGYGNLQEQVIQYAKNKENIYFHKAVSSDILLNYTSSADFGISTIEDTCLSYKYCLPNKMFEYIMAGLPVLTSNLVEMKKIVNQYNIGAVVEENSVEGIIEGIKKIIKLEKGELHKNLEEVKEIFNWHEQEKILLEIYKKLC